MRKPAEKEVFIQVKKKDMKNPIAMAMIVAKIYGACFFFIAHPRTRGSVCQTF
jgi:hypothetical protein